jgi:hypothetical protein
MFALCSAASGQQGKSKNSLTGRWEGTARDKAEEVITLTLDLTEKEGTLSGTIKSSHGDFPTVGGSCAGEKVTLEFDAGGPTGSISLRMTDDRLVGTWNTGDNGGPVDVKKVAAQEGAPKG